MNLKDVRKRFDLTQKDLAKILQVSQSKVSDLENGILELKVSELGKLIDALNLTWDYYEDLIKTQTDLSKNNKKE